MMQMVHSRFNALLSACVLSLIATAGWSQSLTWLGTLPSGTSSGASGVSDNGVVVGWSGGRAFRWQNGVMQDLGTLPGGTWSYALAVSAYGAVVVGGADNAAGQRRAFLWTASGGMQDLGTLPGGTWSEARGVGVSDVDGAVVVGWATNAAGQRRAFVWRASGGMQELDPLGGSESRANSVSADGAVVVGGAYNADEDWRAFRGMQDLGTLPGGTWSEASGVSADGRAVVGWSSTAYSPYRAFLLTAWGGMQDLGTLGGESSYASGVSYNFYTDFAVVVGWSSTAEGYTRAFRWKTWGGMENLNTTYASLLTDGSTLIEANAISPNWRYIVGTGYNATRLRYEAFLLDTVPEPASLMALSAGLVGLLGLRRRRSKQ